MRAEGTSAEGAPEITVAVNLEGNSVGEGRYSVGMKISATAKTAEKTRFLVELDYVGIFQLANVREDYVHPVIFIECPRQLLPFARRVIADVTRDGGYPPLMLDNVDFATLYRQRLAEFQAQRTGEEGKRSRARRTALGETSKAETRAPWSASQAASSP